MQTKLLSIFCMSLLLISNIESSYTYRDNNDFVLFDMTGKPTLIKLDNNSFDLNVKNTEVYLSMPMPQSGYLLAKKEGNHNLTAPEAGDLFRFVEQNQSIQMGMEYMEDTSSVSNALDLINAVEDSDRTAHEFIRMTEFTHSVGIFDVRNQFYSDKAYYSATINADYSGSSDVLKDEEDSLADTVFNPEEATDAATELASLSSDYYIKPMFRDKLSNKEDYLEVGDMYADDFKEKFAEAITFTDYELQLNRDSFMSHFNSVISGEVEMNLFLRAAIYLKRHNYYLLLQMPKAIGDEHTQEQEDERMAFTKEVLFYNLCEVLADRIGSNMDDRHQGMENQKVLIELRDTFTKFMVADYDGVSSAVTSLTRFFNSTLTANRVEIMFWMMLFEDQIKDYIYNYLVQLNSDSTFKDLFISDDALDYGKFESVLKYFDTDNYAGVKKFYLFVKARRNLLLV